MERKNEIVNQSYFRMFEDPISSDIADYDMDLRVNCCGLGVLRKEWQCQKIKSRNDFYLIYLLSGVIMGDIGGEPVRMESGSVVCILPGTEYLFGSEMPASEKTIYSWLHFTGREAERMVLGSGLTLNKAYSVGHCDEVFSFYERLFSEFRNMGESFEYDSTAHLRYILYVFGKAMRKNSVNRLDKSIRYIYTHLRHEITVEELAAMEYLGVSRYRELFKSITGLSPIEYITRLRISRAKDLLTQNDASIEEVGEASGYENRYYFQRLLLTLYSH